MKLLSQSAEHISVQDIVALDYASTGIKMVRVKRTGAKLVLTGVGLFPPQGDGTLVRPVFDKKFTTNYVALAYSAPNSVVRVVTPAASGAVAATEQQLREQIGLDSSCRLSYRPAGQIVKGKKDGRLLAVAIPDREAKAVLGLFAEGAPAPCSLEVSGLASLNAAFHGPVARDPQAAVCLLDCGANVSMMAFINKGAVILARKLDVGGEAVVERVQKSLGVDRAMAASIMSEGSIDITQAVRDVADSFLRQLMISRDFVERQENCRVATAYITGGMSLSQYWINEIRRGTGMNVLSWDPLEGMELARDAYPDEFKGQECRFAAALGAAQGVLLES